MLMKIRDLFDIEYPKTLIYSDMTPDSNGINFVSSKGINNSVVSKVKMVDGLKVYPAGVITVPLKGTVLAAHLQSEPCYVAHQIAVLIAKQNMTKFEKLFYCTCIQHNSYRYSYGRQADKSLAELEIPDNIPDWVYSNYSSPLHSSINPTDLNSELKCSDWKEYTIDCLFDVKYGINLELQNLTITDPSNDDAVNFVARTSRNNGVVASVKKIEDIEPQPAGIITCAGGGSVLSTFVQNKPFYSGRDLYLLIPKFEMSLLFKLFCCTMIESNRYRYNYGRQANKTMPHIIIKLPTNSDGSIDGSYIDSFMSQLKYSDLIF